MGVQLGALSVTHAHDPPQHQPTFINHGLKTALSCRNLPSPVSRGVRLQHPVPPVQLLRWLPLRWSILLSRRRDQAAQDRRVLETLPRWWQWLLLQEDLPERSWRRAHHPRLWLHQGGAGGAEGVLHHRAGGVQHRGLLMLWRWMQLCQHVPSVRCCDVSCGSRLPPPLILVVWAGRQLISLGQLLEPVNLTVLPNQHHLADK